MNLNFRKLGAGKPFFILHGLLGMSDNWASVGKILSALFEVYLIDLRNHGGSPHSDEWTYPIMAKDVAELIRTQSIRQPISLMGHSMGGKVAMQFAALYPELSDKVTIVDISPKDYPTHQFAFIEKLLPINLRELKTRKEAETILTPIVKDWATVQLLLKNIYWVPLSGTSTTEVLDWRFNLKVIAEKHNTIGNTFSIGEKPISIPTQFIRGEKSKYIPDSDLPEIKRYFPNSALITIEGAGHWVHADKQKEFVQEVITFHTASTTH